MNTYYPHYIGYLKKESGVSLAHVGIAMTGLTKPKLIMMDVYNPESVLEENCDLVVNST